MENADLSERTEQELGRVIWLAHREGLNYWQILRLIPNLITDLIIQAEIEYRVKGGR